MYEVKIYMPLALSNFFLLYTTNQSRRVHFFRKLLSPSPGSKSRTIRSIYWVVTRSAIDTICSGTRFSLSAIVLASFASLTLLRPTAPDTTTRTRQQSVSSASSLFSYPLPSKSRRLLGRSPDQVANRAILQPGQHILLIE